MRPDLRSVHCLRHCDQTSEFPISLFPGRPTATPCAANSQYNCCSFDSSKSLVQNDESARVTQLWLVASATPKPSQTISKRGPVTPSCILRNLYSAILVR